MQKLNRIFKDHKHLVFLDFEGTQFSHEMIAIGAVMCTLDKKGRIKTMKNPYRTLVKAKNKVGRYVVELTGITDTQISKEGISFAQAMNGLKKYCGLNFKKSSFITFGSHDLTILNRSISYSLDYPKEICSQVQKNYVDFLAFLSEFIKDPKGNQISLHHFCELFGVEEQGIAHNPAYDAVNLALLYDAVIEHPEILKDEYKKVLKNFNHFPQPVTDVIRRLVDGQTVTPDNLEEFIKNYIK